LKAKRAASTWWGLRSTWALATAPASLSTLSDAQRLVSSWAKYRAWYEVKLISSATHRQIKVCLLHYLKLAQKQPA
jgi:hypothetical protein